MSKIVRYRLDVDFYSRDYDNKACSTSSPIYTKKEGLKAYSAALKKSCIDIPELPPRVHLWRYTWDENGKCCPVTIRKNY